MALEQPRRVVTSRPMPPEKCAYALARYSRLPDSIGQSIDWVRTHDSAKFLAALLLSVRPFLHRRPGTPGGLLRGDLRSGRHRNRRRAALGRAGEVLPLPGFLPLRLRHAARVSGARGRAVSGCRGKLLAAYNQVHAAVAAHLAESLPRPADMKEDAYQRNIAARAFDVARYLLFLGIPTNVGQITSIRTLEKQIRRLKASEYAELRSLAGEIAAACAAEPGCSWDENAPREPVAPTLAQWVGPDSYLLQSRRDLKLWAEQNLPAPSGITVDSVDLLRPADTSADIVATLLYPVTRPAVPRLVRAGPMLERRTAAEVLDLGARSRTRPGRAAARVSAAACSPTTSSWTSAPTAISTGTAAASSSGRRSPAGLALRRRRQSAKPAVAESL